MPSQSFIFKDKFNNDPLYAKNNQLRLEKHEELPISSINQMQFGQNQIANATMNAFFNKLIQNDLLIKQKLDMRDEKLYPTTTKIVDMYATNTSYMQTTDYYTEQFNNHIENQHKDRGFLDIINLSSTKKDCSNLNLQLNKQHFTLSSSENNHKSLSVENDIVKEFKFETDYPEDTYVIVNVYNEQSDYKPVYEIPLDNEKIINGTLPQIQKVPFILKKWVSGLRDLYIYVGTTFTFYNGSLENLAKNLQKPTILEVKLNKTFFDIRNIYDIQINGMSLPLRITEKKISEFKDVILPSSIRGLPFGDDKIENVRSLVNDKKYWYLYFTIYGTDAQAIKISYDTEHMEEDTIIEKVNNELNR